MSKNPRIATTVTVGLVIVENQKVLTLNPSTVQLGPGDWVEWNFEGVSAEDLADTLPFIQFDTSLGPFQCLQSIPPIKVQGKGNTGVAGSYTYKAGLLGEASVEAASPVGSVVNPPQDENTSPVATVKFKAGAEDTVEIDINPTTPLTLCKGDTVLWHVLGLPPETSISFQFNLADSTLDPLVGPFESLLVDRVVEGQGVGLMRIIGTNFNPDDRDQYTYHIALRDASGNVLASHDPVIDNLGQPPS